MLKICIEGWRDINQSWAIVNQRQLLELIKLPIYLKHKDIPYFQKSWNAINNANGFTEEENKILSSIKSPDPDENFDVVYRMSYPINLKESSSKKLFVYGTSEFQSTEDMFINGDPKEVSKREILSIITPSNWSKKGFLFAGFKEENVKVVPAGVDCNIFFPLNKEKRKSIRNKFNIKEKDFILLSIGAMTKNKGIDLLIIAFAILRKKYENLKLILKDQSNLYGVKSHSIVKSLKNSKYNNLLTDDVISNILSLSENLNFNQLSELYGASDCYISPYRGEGFNIPPLEAAACGVPIVVTKGGSTDDYFDSKIGTQISSKLVKTNLKTILEPDLDSLIESISLVIENCDNYGGIEGCKYVNNNFSWKIITEKLLKTINI